MESDEKLISNIDEIAVEDLLDNSEAEFKKLCFDKNPTNDKRNAKLIKMLASCSEIKKIINHGTNQTLSGLELVSRAALIIYV